jgi:predicted O-methyltransferase YrrM
MLRKLKKLLLLWKMRRSVGTMLISYATLLEQQARLGTVWGSIAEEEEPELINLTRQASAIPGPIIEIGSLFGFTAQLIATYKPAEKKLIAVECFAWNPFGLSPDDHRAMTRRVLRYNMTHSNTTLFGGFNRDFYQTYEGERPAMVFIDADHTYEGVKEDISWAVRKGVPIIAGHDYSDLWPGVQRAVDEAFRGDITVKGSVWCHCQPD